ncbi:Rieske (2Fe-2S) protein [Paenibacillus gansuensis]|uniref:Rieske (2Fe-2S) protein n=1 Tax=Paenibacillus gansuensis TaxID=306542 RepID=A0ABW5PD98_9BACL
MKEWDLGALESFTSFPAAVEQERDKYYILKNGEKYKLVSRDCPHAGYTVEAEDDEIVCPLHGWTFDAETGVCQNVPVRELACFEIQVKDGHLIALIQN